MNSGFTGENLLRELAPKVLGAVIRRFGDFSAAEDAVQEALLAAALQWPEEGVPDNPRGWLIHVAARRMTDHIRAELARRRRETAVIMQQPADHDVVPAPDSSDSIDQRHEDDTLILLFMCCHPALTRPSAIALTLRAVGGLTTAEIANAFLVPESTMAQRISRAKHRIKTSGVPFRMPTPDERSERLGAVLHVLYLIFNEGYASSVGPNLQRSDLANEAIRLTRSVHHLLPADGEVAGLLALMLLTDARRGARTGPDGELIPLADQDRTLWDRQAIDEGVALISATRLEARSDVPNRKRRSRRCTMGRSKRYRLAADSRLRPRSGCRQPMVTLNTRSRRPWCRAARRTRPMAELDRTTAWRTLPPRRGARAPARNGRRAGGSGLPLRSRGQPNREHSRARLSDDAGRAAGGHGESGGQEWPRPQLATDYADTFKPRNTRNTRILSSHGIHGIHGRA